MNSVKLICSFPKNSMKYTLLISLHPVLGLEMVSLAQLKDWEWDKKASLALSKGNEIHLGAPLEAN